MPDMPVRLVTDAEPGADQHDLVVIGAGINGLAIAREAAMRGLKVVVLERDDIGGRTTAISTRLVHAGLKYLERLDFRLVLESVHEQQRLLRQAPHLVRRYPMLIPFYRQHSRPGVLIAAGFVAMWFLSLGSFRFRFVGRRRLEREWPGLRRGRIGWGGVFDDAQVPLTERLCVEIALSAVEHGASILTRRTVVGIETTDGVATGVWCHSGSEPDPLLVRGRVVVNASGPWVDEVLASDGEPLVGPTKGSHVIVEPFPGAPAVCVFFEAADKRPVFVLPWQGRIMIGSTDLPYDGPLDDIRASDEEIEYLLDAVNALVPGAGLTTQDVLWSYAGVRPLPYVADLADPASVTRGHAIVEQDGVRNLFSLVGGKLTTHRALAEDVLRVVAPRLDRSARRSPSRNAEFPGGPARAGARTAQEMRAKLVRSSSLDIRAAARLVAVYGARAVEVEQIASGRADLRAVVDAETGAIAAEVVHAFVNEGARTLEDVLMRRMVVGLGPDLGLTAAQAVAKVAADHQGWTAERTAAELTSYRDATERFRSQARHDDTASAASEGVA